MRYLNLLELVHCVVCCESYSSDRVTYRTAVKNTHEHYLFKKLLAN